MGSWRSFWCDSGARLGAGKARSPHLPEPLPAPPSCSGRPGRCRVERRGTLPGWFRSPVGRGGAGAFFGGRGSEETRSLGLAARARAVKSGRPAPTQGRPVRGAPAPQLRTTRRAGAEGWVFAGEMRVSVQLAYKVPVLGSRDRRLLRAPGPRELSAQAGTWPVARGRAASSRVHSGEGVARHARRRRPCAEIAGIPALPRSEGTALENWSRSLCALRVLGVKGDPRGAEQALPAARPRRQP